MGEVRSSLESVTTARRMALACELESQGRSPAQHRGAQSNTTSRFPCFRACPPDHELGDPCPDCYPTPLASAGLSDAAALPVF
jgi:hypothetical protein